MITYLYTTNPSTIYPFNSRIQQKRIGNNIKIKYKLSDVGKAVYFYNVLKPNTLGEIISLSALSGKLLAIPVLAEFMAI